MLIPPVTDFILSSIVLEALSLACLIAEEIISSSISTVSESTAVGFSGLTASADNLIDLNVNVEEACVFQEYFSQFMNYLNCKLDDKEKEILFKRVGYGYDKPYSLSKIALEYSVSRETIRRWEDRIFKRLNKTREGKCFNPYRK